MAPRSRSTFGLVRPASSPRRSPQTRARVQAACRRSPAVWVRKVPHCCAVHAPFRPCAGVSAGPGLSYCPDLDVEVIEGFHQDSMHLADGGSRQRPTGAAAVSQQIPVHLVDLVLSRVRSCRSPSRGIRYRRTMVRYVARLVMAMSNSRSRASAPAHRRPTQRLAAGCRRRLVGGLSAPQLPLAVLWRIRAASSADGGHQRPGGGRR
jgi:hypothetical protein